MVIQHSCCGPSDFSDHDILKTIRLSQDYHQPCPNKYSDIIGPMPIDLNIKIDANCEHNIVKAVGGRATAGGKVHDPYLIQELIDFAGPYTKAHYKRIEDDMIPFEISEPAIEYVLKSNKPSSYKQ